MYEGAKLELYFKKNLSAFEKPGHLGKWFIKSTIYKGLKPILH